MAPITGTAGNDNQALGGRDLIGTAFDDQILGLAVDDNLIGGNGNDNLQGGDGNDSFDGGAGKDFLIGGTGNDTYNVTGGGDTIREAISGGTDTVLSSISFTLPASVENLRLSELSGEINGTGNNLNNTITGNNLKNTLIGAGGNDTLSGENGDDTLQGGDGNDTLNGGAGSDRFFGEKGNDILNGGTGDDLYFIEDPGETIKEAADGGIDSVASNVSFTLPANVEKLLLEDGGGDSSGTGNDLNNTITGNESNNTLNGGGRNDSLDGGIGNDILLGSGGNDTLRGNFGNDTLLGGAGQDSFTFNTSTSEEGIDEILDFTAVDDTIRISKAGFASGLVSGAISSEQLVLGSAATDDNDRFIYNNGALSFDPDGIGTVAQVQLATLTAAPTLGAADIVVF